MNFLRSHFSVYYKASRYFLLILSTIILVNISVQFFVMYMANGSFTDISIISVISPLWGMLIGTMIGFPIMLMSSFPYLLNFNSRRKDILISGAILNAIIAFAISIIILLLLYTFNTFSQLLSIFYMGVIIAELTWKSMLLLLWLNFGLMFTLSNAIYFISTVFYRYGIMYGLSAIALFLSLLAFVSPIFYQLYIWGDQQFLVGLLLLIVSMLFIYGSWQMLSKAEIKKSSFKKRDILVLALVVALLAFCLNSGGNPTQNNLEGFTYGQFSYMETESIDKQFNVTDEKYLYINWRSKVDSGSIQLQIMNPLNEVVYEVDGNDLDITKIPLSAGTWTYKISIDDATEGNYKLNALIK